MDVSEKDVLQRVKARQGILSKIEDALLLGRGTREDLKELDKQLREDYHNDILDLRHQWEKIHLQILEAHQPSLSRKSKTVILSYDRVMTQINRASYGYAPLFDRRGGIGQTELARVFGFDEGIGTYLQRLREEASKVSDSVGANDWRVASGAVDSVKRQLDEIERRWNEREKYFRSKEV